MQKPTPPMRQTRGTLSERCLYYRRLPSEKAPPCDRSKSLPSLSTIRPRFPSRARRLARSNCSSSRSLWKLSKSDTRSLPKPVTMGCLLRADGRDVPEALHCVAGPSSDETRGGPDNTPSRILMPLPLDCALAPDPCGCDCADASADSPNETRRAARRPDRRSPSDAPAPSKSRVRAPSPPV